MKIDMFMEKLFARAQQENFAAFEAYYASGDSFEVAVKDGEILNYAVASSLGLNFRALQDGRMGYASTQVLDEEAIDLLIEGVRENARLIENDDEEFIYEGAAEYPNLDVYNPAIDQLTAAEKIETARQFERLLVSQDPRATRSEMVQLFTESAERRIVNSKGMNVSFRENVYGLYGGVLAEENGKVFSGGAVKCARDPGEINMEEMAKDAVKEAVDGLSAAPVASGEYRAALRWDVAASILKCFDSVFGADMAQRGLSLLKGREGDVIASEAVTIVDDPLNPIGLSATPFDAEGVATCRREIVSKGKLNTLLHNLKTAAKQGVATTGNASKGSYAAPVGVAPTNFYIQASDMPVEELYEKVGDGLLITDLAGLHAGANQISGDFSLSAKGYCIEGGKLGRAVDQITVAGNFFDLLKNVEAVGSDLKFGFPGASCVGSPTLLLTKLSVAGK